MVGGREEKNSLECLIDAQTRCHVPLAVKHKSNSLPKSAFSNIHLKVAEIREQLEVLKQSSHISGSKALQQVFPRIRPPSVGSGVSGDFSDEGYVEQEGGKKDAPPPRHYTTPVNPHNPIYSHLGCATTDLAQPPDYNNPAETVKFYNHNPAGGPRPGFVNNRPMSMPSPPLHNSPGASPGSCSPRSLSPNPQNSPKYNIRPSGSYYACAPVGGAASSAHAQSAPSRLPRPFPEFGCSPASSPSTLSPCSSNSLPSSQSRLPSFKSMRNTPGFLALEELFSGKGFDDFDKELDPKQVEKLILFFEVMSTQEKISKVNNTWCGQGRVGIGCSWRCQWPIGSQHFFHILFGRFFQLTAIICPLF